MSQMCALFAWNRCTLALEKRPKQCIHRYLFFIYLLNKSFIFKAAAVSVGVGYLFSSRMQAS